MKRSVTVLLGLAALVSFYPAPAARAETKPGDADYDVKVKRLFDFLPKEYESMLVKNKDRVSRSLLEISISRVPTYEMTSKLLEMIKKESDPLVRAVAWECVISRSKLLNGDNYTKLLDATHTL